MDELLPFPKSQFQESGPAPPVVESEKFTTNVGQPFRRLAEKFAVSCENVDEQKSRTRAKKEIRFLLPTTGQV